uniref:CWH43-like N-terminal domain-containing protein n=1 Tax=Oncorhynchus kisutch TaxID=8019 RepID=A0A8C7F8M8_ONCKI
MGGIKILTAVLVLARFGIAVLNETVNITDRFPYISCIFAQICNVCAPCGFIVLGFISCVGISIIGNSQQSVLIGIHLLGAFLAFFGGLAYFQLQVWLCYKAHPFKDRHCVGPLRATFCSICSILVITMAILHNTSYKSGAAVCEWALVMSFFVLFGLFGSEFRHIDFHQLTVQKQGLKTQITNGVVS